MSAPDVLPPIANEAELEELLSRPSPAVIEAVRRVDGDVLVLGAGGKMGLSLTTMLRRATEENGGTRRIIAASRFTRPGQAEAFAAQGMEVRRGDLLDPAFLHQLPSCPNLIFMTGVKFGTGDQAELTWAMNVLLPARVCEIFPEARILAFSTGNVYPLIAPETGGCREQDVLEPVGEYGMTAVGRERIFSYLARRNNQPLALLRLNYAVEMRYGVLVDLAKQVLAGTPIDLSMGHANVIWQGDANRLALCALADAAQPALVLNIAGPEIFTVQEVCEQFARALGVAAQFVGQAQPTALLNHGGLAHRRYEPPEVSLHQMIAWIAAWMQSGQATWDKPTHFENRCGRF